MQCGQLNRTDETHSAVGDLFARSRRLDCAYFAVAFTSATHTHRCNGLCQVCSFSHTPPHTRVYFASLVIYVTRCDFCVCTLVSLCAIDVPLCSP